MCTCARVCVCVCCVGWGRCERTSGVVFPLFLLLLRSLHGLQRGKEERGRGESEAYTHTHTRTHGAHSDRIRRTTDTSIFTYTRTRLRVREVGKTKENRVRLLPMLLYMMRGAEGGGRQLRWDGWCGTGPQAE